MNKSIKIMYEDFVECNGKIEKELKIAIIPFSENTVEYKNSDGYVENFENLVYEILQNGFVYINETEVITILNIKKFIGNNDSQKVYNTQNKQNSNNQNQDQDKNQDKDSNQNKIAQGQNRIPQGQNKKWRKHNRRQRNSEQNYKPSPSIPSTPSIPIAKPEETNEKNETKEMIVKP